MTPNEVRTHFLALANDTLAADVAQDCTQQLEQNSELKREFDEFATLYRMTKLASHQTFQAGPSFAQEVMERINKSSPWAQCLSWCRNLFRPAFFPTAATVAAVCVAITTLSYYSTFEQPHSRQTQTNYTPESSAGLTPEDHEITYNDAQIAQSVVAILTYIEGSFGALVMLVSTILGIALLGYGYSRESRAAKIAGGVCILIALLAFGLRGVCATVFNTQAIW